MITELFVPRHRLADFMSDVAENFRGTGADVVYGTIRLIERDDVTFLPWARERWACVIFNLHIVHTSVGLQRAVETFRRLIDMAIARGGSYYLTYHRWARPDQVGPATTPIPGLPRAKRHLPDSLPSVVSPQLPVPAVCRRIVWRGRSMLRIQDEGARMIMRQNSRSANCLRPRGTSCYRSVWAS